MGRFDFVRERCVLPLAFFAAASALAATPVMTIAAEANAMRFVVGSGPLAGTYPIRPHDVNCVSTASGIAASFKFVGTPDKNRPHVSNLHVANSKTISEAQVVVDNPTDRGAKRGSVSLMFGNRGEHPVEYLAFVPGGGTLTQTPAGSGSAFAFKGRTKDGIALEASAICRDTMKL